MVESPRYVALRNVSDLLLAKASQHGTLDAADRAAIRDMRSRVRVLAATEDIVHQGERPDVAVLVLGGMLGRYHTLPSGDRQYLSFHISGDMPDVQSLFLIVMDHSVCAMNRSEIALFPHDQSFDGDVC